MQKTAEAVSLGHPDKTSDYISSYILDRMIEQDKAVKYAVEVMLKDNTVILGGEIKGNVSLDKLKDYVLKALEEVGYTQNYAKIWGKYAIEPEKIKVINLIGQQSAEINQGVEQDGWGDQGVFVGYACQGEGMINRELYLARKLNRALYQKALQSKHLGLDIKTQITLDDEGKIETAIVAIPMLKTENLTQFVIDTLGEKPKNIIINGNNDVIRKIPQSRNQFFVRAYLGRIKPYFEDRAFGFEFFKLLRQYPVREFLSVKVQYNPVGKQRAIQDRPDCCCGIRDRCRKGCK